MQIGWGNLLYLWSLMGCSVAMGQPCGHLWVEPRGPLLAAGYERVVLRAAGPRAGELVWQVEPEAGLAVLGLLPLEARGDTAGVVALVLVDPLQPAGPVGLGVRLRGLCEREVRARVDVAVGERHHWSAAVLEAPTKAWRGQPVSVRCLVVNNGNVREYVEALDASGAPVWSDTVAAGLRREFQLDLLPEREGVELVVRAGDGSAQVLRYAVDLYDSRTDVEVRSEGVRGAVQYAVQGLAGEAAGWRRRAGVQASGPGGYVHASRWAGQAATGSPVFGHAGVRVGRSGNLTGRAGSLALHPFLRTRRPGWQLAGEAEAWSAQVGSLGWAADYRVGGEGAVRGTIGVVQPWGQAARPRASVDVRGERSSASAQLLGGAWEAQGQFTGGPHAVGAWGRKSPRGRAEEHLPDAGMVFHRVGGGWGFASQSLHVTAHGWGWSALAQHSGSWQPRGGQVSWDLSRYEGVPGYGRAAVRSQWGPPEGNWQVGAEADALAMDGGAGRRQLLARGQWSGPGWEARVASGTLWAVQAGHSEPVAQVRAGVMGRGDWGQVRVFGTGQGGKRPMGQIGLDLQTRKGPLSVWGRVQQSRAPQRSQMAVEMGAEWAFQTARATQTLEGRVVGPGGEGLAGIRLRCEGREVMTDPQGHFAFRHLSEPLARVDWVAADWPFGTVPAEGVAPTFVLKGARTQVELHLVSRVQVKGALVLPALNIWYGPVDPGGWRVRWTADDGTVVRCAVDGDGRFDVALPAGRYRVRVEGLGPGLEVAEREIGLDGSEVALEWPVVDRRKVVVEQVVVN